MSEVRLPGRQCVLRDWRAADVPVFREWQDPRHRWHDTNGPYFGRPTEADAARQTERLATLAATDPADRPDPRDWLAVADPDTDAPVGAVTWYWESEPTDWRRMGVILWDPASWGRGIGSAAMARWTSYLFARTGARRLDFATYSGNPGMCAIGRKLGFTEEARFRQARPWAGEVYDSVVYGVLRTEWPPAHLTDTAPAG